MKKLIILAAGLTMACNSSQKTVTEPMAKPKVDAVASAETITEAELKEHLFIYASDEFEGRETGTAGQKKAVAYLQGEYEKLGIPAAKSDGDYFQKVPLEISKLPTGKVSVGEKEFVLGNHILSFSATNGTFDSVIYAGYGIEHEGYSDYAEIDVKNQYVLVKAGEPMNKDSIYTISGTKEKSLWSNISEALSKKMQLAKDKGARGVLYFDDANYPRFKSRYDYMKTASSGNMSIVSDEKNDYVSFFVDKDFATAINAGILTDHKAKTIPVSLNFELASTNESIDSENVAAILKGSEKPDEYVVISSHLDHIGVNGEGEINNGADDDGSGTVALLEIAEAFKTAADAGNGPKRSIVFLHVTGEEKGLLGSQYYTDFDPIFPLEQTVANLNIDMIGRIDPKREGDRNYIYLIGSDKLSTELHELSEEVNAKYMNIELDYTYNDENDPNRFYYRSDHYNFAKNNIPIIFYFNGTHDDYHRPGDTPDKINYDLLQNRSRLVFHTAWEVANRAGRVTVDKATE